MSNFDIVNKASDLTLKACVTFVGKQLIKEYGADWWREGVLRCASETQLRNIQGATTDTDKINSLDFALCMTIIKFNWRDVFKKVLSPKCQSWAGELASVRVDAAHRGVKDYSDSDTERALDTMSRLLDQMSNATADESSKGIRTIREEIDGMLREVKYGSQEGSRAGVAAASGSGARKKELAAVQIGTLPSWRDVMVPHQDVARGEYRNAEFAADLSQVATGTAAREYQDPVEFFSRTYVTSGMKELLVQSLRRVSGQGGEPVIQLKTAFGGGKTHSMLALYHLLREGGSSLPNTAEVLAAVGLDAAPRVHVAVEVGTALNPAKASRPADFPGITINTMWGDIAAQLARSAGNPDLYKIVQDADRKHVSPGSAAFRELFDACGPCLVLLDELVAYAKKLSDEKLPAGTFDNFITFIQEITEGARASKNALIVASIPQSDNEIGGENGQKALEAIEHTFGRMESVWKPVSASEGFEVVRRRLFLDCKQPQLRDAVCAKFSEMYQSGAGDFPVEAKELEYHNRLQACYPIHPEFFDRLYEDWATLETFQRTRSVLRLMASVIHELWEANDPSPMIMPGSLPLDISSVQSELTRYLPENWNGIIDSEVDGKRSIPRQVDSSNVRYGKLFAARRVARTIMLGSAPDVQGQSARGLEATRVRLGCVQPSESIAVFNDALGQLKAKSSYLYSDVSGSRYWYDTRPTLRKTMEDRATQLDDADADGAIQQVMKKWRAAAPFAGLHLCPGSSLDVPDEQSVRLVVFAPGQTHASSAGGSESAAMKAARDMLENRGQSQRKYRNMLLFLAPESSQLADVRRAAREHLAWKSIHGDREGLNLDASQMRETENSVKSSAATLEMKVGGLYSWLICPRVDLASGSQDVCWDVERLSVAGGNPVEAATAKARVDELVIERWAPALLRMELDRLLWKNANHIQVKQLREMLCSYCYLPRLASADVLERAICDGLASDEFFALAAGVATDADGSERYLSLRLGKGGAGLNASDFLVRADVARAQLEAEARAHEVCVTGDARVAVAEDISPVHDAGGGAVAPVLGDVAVKAEELRPRIFRMRKDLDSLRVKRDMNQIIDEVISLLEDVDGCEVSLTLEVAAASASGFPVPTVRAVTENCKVLGLTGKFSE